MCVLPLYIHSSNCENGGGAMELLFIQLLYLLFFGIIGITIIAIALIITLVIILSQ